MALIKFGITLAVVGTLLWFINTYILMDRRVRQLLNIVTAVSVALWAASLFGVFDYVRSIHLGN